MSLHPEMPAPKSLPFVGSLFELDGNALVQSMTKLSARLGPIYDLTVLGQSTYVLGGQALVNEVCDETRYGKLVHTALMSLRPALGDGLFTAHTHEPNWTLAHRILMPAFGPLGIRGMFAKMMDIADQMFARWDRFGPETEIDVADTMTRLTLDTLALCAFDFRFNSFYRDAMHPFVDAMVGSLVEASARDRRPPFVSQAMIRTRRRFEHDIAAMHEMADALLADRRRGGGIGDRGDLLDAMLVGTDAVTGERLGDENIRYQLVTFLIAGHETTSGLLSFAVYLLLQHPTVMEAARRDVDEVLGEREPTFEDLAKLRLIEQILMETLRLWPTAPAFAVTPHEPTILGGEYSMIPGDEILVLLPALHRDPTVWGDDPESFRPERFAAGVAERLPPNAWKPFGNGQRACIGRGFAMQEAQLVLAMLLQRFDVAAADPEYQLQISETLTMKPEGFRIRAKLRQPRSYVPTMKRHDKPQDTAPDPLRSDGTGTPLLVLHGGNSGSSYAFARRIAVEGGARGFSSRVAALDEAVDALPREGAVVIAAASYEGQPADNARRFVAWLDDRAEGELEGVRYAVLGSGNRQWARTYQAIPKRIDLAMARAGASRLVERGEADAAGDYLGAVDAWIETLWSTLSDRFGSGEVTSATIPSEFRIEVSRPLAGSRWANCSQNVGLTDSTIYPVTEKRHIDLMLPPGMAYRAGDHLAIRPSNPPETVARALRRLGISPDATVTTITDPGGVLPSGEGLTVRELLADHFELEQAATPEQIRLFTAIADNEKDRARAGCLLNQALDTNDRADCKLGTLSLLESMPSCDITLEKLLPLLPPLTARRYSIASSPEAGPSRCALTVSVVERRHTSGIGPFLGVASTYLSRLPVTAPLAVTHQPSAPAFHLPDDPMVPIIMIAAGSGIAPFRGFVEERAILHSRGKRVGPALLFFGCRHPEADWLYREEFAIWQAEGVVDVRPAFSRAPIGGVRYVQDRVLQNGEEVVRLARAGAHVYVCGDAYGLVPAVESALIDIASTALATSPEVAKRWTRRFVVLPGRYAVDAFA